MRRDQVGKKIQRKGLVSLLPVRRKMTSVVCKRLKCHILDTCEHFIEKTSKEKTKLLAKAKCCYAFYHPMSKNHNVKNCTQRLIC